MLELRAMTAMRNIIYGLEGLFFPKLCLACYREMPPGELKICLHCRASLYYSDDHEDPRNAFSNRLYGRVPFLAASSLLIYKKGGKTQSLLHALKYKGNQLLGVELGEQHGALLAKTSYFSDIDWILPVPLHIKKRRLRGYNQSAAYAQGLSEKMNVPFSDSILVRRVFTETQTKKGMEDRFRNVKSVFGVAKPELVRQKHVLIVDDVMTTGATLEACTEALLDAVDVRISFATIALAVQ